MHLRCSNQKQPCSLSIGCCVLFSVLIAQPKAHAQELLIGLSAGYRQLNITSSDGKQKLAQLKTPGVSLMPSLTLSSAAQLIGDSQWGWTYSGNIFFSGIDRQIVTTDRGTTTKNKDTRVTGISLFFNPIIYYQFANRGLWQWRLGAGLGLGYQNHWGTFVVTNTDSDNYGEKEKLRVTGIGASAGLYLQLSYGRHHFIVNGDQIAHISSIHGDDFNYRYSESAVYLTYSYSLPLF